MRNFLRIFIFIISLFTSVTFADESVVILGDKYFKPYLFENSKGNPDGLFFDLTDKIMNKIDVKYKMDLTSLSASKEAFYTGKGDILIKRVEAKENGLYSLPIFTMHYLIVSKDKDIKKIQDFREKRIMIDLNSSFDRDMKSLNLDLQIIKRSLSVEAMIEKLNSGEIDGFVSLDVFFQIYLLDHYISPDLGMFKVSMIPLDYCFVLKSNESKLLLDINSAIMQLELDGTYSKICNEWFVPDKIENFTKTIILSIVIIIFSVVLYYFVNQLINISKEKNVNNAYLKMILNSIPFPVFCAEVKGKNVEFWNGAAIDMFGNVENKKITSNLTKECYEDLLFVAGKVMITGIPYNSTFSVKLKSNKSYNVLADISIITNNDIKYLLFVFTDISEILESRIKARRSDKLKSSFLANMSHEIRTPLNAIVGFSRLMMDSTNKDEKRQYADIINFNNELLLRMISDVIDLSKVQSQSLVFDDKQTDVVDLLNKLDLIYTEKLRKGPVDFIFLNPYKKFISSLDKDKVMQCVTNIINNAIKYTASGKIEFGVMYKAGKVYVFVKDTGIGISKQNATRLFNKYEKLDSFAEGTGLGLYLVKSIIEAKGGEIKVVSKEGFGSIFCMIYPCEVTYEIKNNYDITHVNNIVEQINNNEYLVD